MTRRTLLTCIFMLSAVAVCGQRWQIAPDGRGVVWKVGSDIPHDDHIEMSGERMAFVLRWGVDSRGAFRQERSLVFPLLRTLPNNTHASLMYRMAADIPSLLGVDGLALQDERVGQVAIDGALEVRSRWGVGKMNVGSARDMKPEPVVEMTRTIFPSRTLPLMCERYTLRNVGAKPLTVSVPEFSQVVTTDPAKGLTGSYVVRGDIAGSGTFTLAAGDSLAFDAVFQAYPGGGEPLHPDVAAEFAARMAFVRECIDANLVLETPDSVIDTQFRYAKLRAAESIVATKGGYMHAPGGESYYAAIWANDQAEYVNPFFPFLGYGVGNASALNSFRHFARFMNPAYEPLPSSVIAEGDDIWITDPKGREHRLAMLRNQTRGQENLSLADFIAPKGDWIGCFAVTAGIGLKELCEKFHAAGDDYNAIMAKLLADRLTEAFAEAVHSFVRRQMWGYETGEAPTPRQVIRGEYRGRRMAFGYPASPDHSLKREVFDLLAAELTTGMKLTENYMVDPGEALCGLLLADADYFSVGTVDTEQLLDYARRLGLDVELVKKLIPHNI